MKITLHDLPINVKKGPSIFLSYGREDAAVVEEIYAKLEKVGYSPWMDTNNILAGELWSKSIKNVLEYCDFFLLCLSPRSVDKRGFLQTEIEDALEIWKSKLDSDIYVIPLKLENNFKIPEKISRFQYLCLSHADWFDKLTLAIETGLNRRKSDEHKISQNIINRWQDDPDLSTKTPYLNITLSLFERHIFHDLMLLKIENQLIEDYSWPEERAHAACFVLNELVSNAFEHGCRGCGELEVIFSLRFQRSNKDLIIRVNSPGSGFSLSNVLKRGSLDSIQGERGRGLLFVNSISSQLTASTDGRIIEAIVLKDRQPHSLTIVPDGLSHGFNSTIIVEIHEERLDSHNSIELKDYLLELLDSRTNILILDLKEVWFVDSSGLGALLRVHKIAGLRDAQFILVNLQSRVQSLLEKIRLTRVFKIFRDEEEAIKYVEKLPIVPKQ